MANNTLIKETPIIVRRLRLEGIHYLIDSNNILYDLNEFLNNGNEVLVGRWDPINRIVLNLNN